MRKQIFNRVVFPEKKSITAAEVKAYVVKECGIGFSFRIRQDPRAIRPSDKALNKKYTIIGFYPGYVQCETEIENILGDVTYFKDSFDYYDIYKIVHPELEEEEK